MQRGKNKFRQTQTERMWKCALVLIGGAKRSQNLPENAPFHRNKQKNLFVPAVTLKRRLL